MFGSASPLFYFLQLVTALILVLAANTAFNGFPVLASILARDGYLPRQLRTRGDRLAYSNGILLLSGFAILLIVVFQASPTRLIQLYIIGVFVSFVCSQTGMIRHWNRLLRTTTDRGHAAAHDTGPGSINTIGACFTGVVLVIVLVSKFASGAWIVVVAMPVIWLTMRGIHRHYESVALELAPPADIAVTLPVQQPGHRPGLQAAPADAARAGLRPGHPAEPARGHHRERGRGRDRAAEGGVGPRRHPGAADRGGLPVPRDHPAGGQYVKQLRRESPRDIVTVFIPEYVLGHWWEQVLHNQSALRLKARLLQQRGVVVASVPYQLKSATKAQASAAMPGKGGAAAAAAAHRGPRRAACRGTPGRDRRRRPPSRSSTAATARWST